MKNVAFWSQGANFNYYSPSSSNSNCDCSRVAAGCGPIAVGMIAKFYQYPSMNMTYNGISMSTNYNSMPINSIASCGNVTSGQKNAAMLIRLIGMSMNSIYNVPGCQTATYPWKLVDGLNFLGFNHDSDGDLSPKYSAMINDLSTGHPVIFSGSESPVWPFTSWHIWVGDGYKETINKYWYPNNNSACNGDPYYGAPGINCGVCEDCVDCYNYTSQKWHMNWGGLGQDPNGTEGWFTISTNSIDDYDEYLKVITGIRKP